MGRVESALEHDLRSRSDIGPAERASLRVVARGLDLCEHLSGVETLDLLDSLSKTFLDLRLAAGLSVRTYPHTVSDPFDELAKALAAGRTRDTEDAEPGD
ncbi:MAG TPA: hypothetical protein VLL25_14805 [Acidimicrobiales bacterium]|nr:hypothetical protein [Acidimicrobiales bacterium]